MYQRHSFAHQSCYQAESSPHPTALHHCLIPGKSVCTCNVRVWCFCIAILVLKNSNALQRSGGLACSSRRAPSVQSSTRRRSTSTSPTPSRSRRSWEWMCLCMASLRELTCESSAPPSNFVQPACQGTSRQGRCICMSSKAFYCNQLLFKHFEVVWAIQNKSCSLRILFPQ